MGIKLQNLLELATQKIILRYSFQNLEEKFILWIAVNVIVLYLFSVHPRVKKVSSLTVHKESFKMPGGEGGI